MPLRNRHLACLLLLLSSLSAEQAPHRVLFARWGGAPTRALGRADFVLGGGYLYSLLLQMQSAAAAGLSQPPAVGADAHSAESLELAPAHRMPGAAAWTMYPPAEYAAALETVTSRLS